MILLRQKTYTRAEREALRELLFKTGRLRRLPGGSKMTSRDVARFNKLAADIQLWAKGQTKPKGADFENARTFLEHAGLGKSAEELEHVAKKYSNKRALARWQRLKNRGNIPDNYLSQDKYDRISKVSKIDKKKCSKVATRDIGEGEGNLMSSLVKDAEKNSVPVIHAKDGGNYLYPSVDFLREKAGGDSKGLERSFLFMGGHLYKKHPFSKKQVKKLRSSLNDKNINNIVVLGRSSGPEILAHELGHHRTLNTTSTGKYLSSASKLEDKAKSAVKDRYDRGDLKDLHDRASQIGRSLNEIANENSATSYGLARLKKHGATPEQLETYKNAAGPNGALGTYINDNRSSIFWEYT